jgi:uncharacterized membrane protein (UPF0127 family)
MSDPTGQPLVLLGPRGIVADRVTLATTFRARRRGVLGRPPLGLNEAFVIEPCRQVHSFGVPYLLDVVFCDRELKVLHLETLEPERKSLRVRRARSCVELLGGRASECGIEPGISLELKAGS